MNGRTNRKKHTVAMNSPRGTGKGKTNKFSVPNSYMWYRGG